jgi:hypothetical protein
MDLADPATFDAWITERIRFSDTDAMGHVNNVAVAAYVESSRVEYGIALARHADDAPGSPDDATGDGQPGFVLARLVIDYLAELHYPGEVRVGSNVPALPFFPYVAVVSADRRIIYREGKNEHDMRAGGRRRNHWQKLRRSRIRRLVVRPPLQGHRSVSLLWTHVSHSVSPPSTHALALEPKIELAAAAPL